MKGTTADPLEKKIIPPNISRTRIIGINQYFFRILKKLHRSSKKPIPLPSNN